MKVFLPCHLWLRPLKGEKLINPITNPIPDFKPNYYPDPNRKFVATKNVLDGKYTG